jgi:hypothetical protein
MRRVLSFWPYALPVLAYAAGLLWSSSKCPPAWSSAAAQTGPTQAWEQRFADVRQRIEARRDIARRVLAHRLSLSEAARRYHRLNLGCAEFNWQRFRESFPGASDEERCCGQVLQMVEGELIHQPLKPRAVETRLLEVDLPESRSSRQLSLPVP